MFEKDLKRFDSAEFRATFISRIYEGDNLREACAFCRVNPAALGVYRRDNPKFDQDIRTAQAFQVDLLVDTLPNIQDHESDAIMAGVISKNIQWVASKRYRQIYGDKLDVNHNVTISIKDAMEEARKRTLVHVTDNALIDNKTYTDNVSVQQAPALPVIDVLPDDDDPLS